MPQNPVGIRSRYFIDLAAYGAFVRHTGLAESTGIENAFQIIRTNEFGKIDQSLIPENLEPGESIVCTEDISAGAFVHIYGADGGRRVRLARHSPDPAAEAGEDAGPFPANGFVTESYNTGEFAIVFVKGTNSRVSLVGNLTFLFERIGERIILGSDGNVFTAARTEDAFDELFKENDIFQVLGTLIDMNATAMRMPFYPQSPIRLTTVYHNEGYIYE
jgi:hypothetical protein